MAKTILLEKGSWSKRKKITIHAPGATFD